MNNVVNMKAFKQNLTGFFLESKACVVKTLRIAIINKYKFWGDIKSIFPYLNYFLTTFGNIRITHLIYLNTLQIRLSIPRHPLLQVGAPYSTSVGGRFLLRRYVFLLGLAASAILYPTPAGISLGITASAILSTGDHRHRSLDVQLCWTSSLDYYSTLSSKIPFFTSLFPTFILLFN